MSASWEDAIVIPAGRLWVHTDAAGELRIGLEGSDGLIPVLRIPPPEISDREGRARMHTLALRVDEALAATGQLR